MTASNNNFPITRRAIVDRANAVNITLTEDMATVWRHVDASDVVFGVWQDRSQPDGVGTLIVKGVHRLQAIVADGRAQALSWTAIPSSDADHAEALRIVADERAPLH